VQQCPELFPTGMAVKEMDLAGYPPKKLRKKLEQITALLDVLSAVNPNGNS